LIADSQIARIIFHSQLKRRINEKIIYLKENWKVKNPLADIFLRRHSSPLPTSKFNVSINTDDLLLAENYPFFPSICQLITLNCMLDNGTENYFRPDDSIFLFQSLSRLNEVEGKEHSM
jgi:hypothetical protein